MEGIQPNRPPIPIGIFAAVFMVVFTVVFGWSAICYVTTPKAFVGESQIEVRLKSDGVKQGRKQGDNDITKTQIQSIGSEAVLRKAIADLDLNEVWGKKYYSGETLKTWESLKILQGRMDIKPVPDTTLIGILIYDDEPNGAVITANAIAKAYTNYIATNSINLRAQVVNDAHEHFSQLSFKKRFKFAMRILTGLFLGFIGGLAAAFFVHRKNCSKLRTDTNLAA